MLTPKFRNYTRRLCAITGLQAALLLSSGCHFLPDTSGLVVFPEAHSRNLAELHRSSGEYKYNGILLGDWGYLAEELQKRERSDFMSPSRIASPSAETVANLSQLLAADHSDPQARAEQLQWCARLVRSDASDLVREIAAQGLTEIALHLQITKIDPLPNQLDVVSEDDLVAVFQTLLREIRLSAEAGAETPEFRAACRNATGLALDLDGAWRLHRLAVELQTLEMDASAKASLYALVRDLEETLVEIGLYGAISDPMARVSLAGLEGYVRILGTKALLPSLTKPDIMLSEAIQFGLLRLTRIYGLPEAGIPPGQRRAILGTLVMLSTEHPSSRVRVQGMLALQAVTPNGPQSLREEDWVEWHSAQTPEMAELP